MAKILLVEDDEILAESLAKFLRLNGFDVDVAKSYFEAGDKTYENKYDLYIFDINLKDGSGIELLEDLRFADDKTPTIFISALRDTKTVVKGFNAGAEDYIKKPFDPEELLVRIKIRLSSHRNTDHQDEKEIKYKNITIKGDRVYKDGKNIELGEVMLNILKTLIENKGKIVHKDKLYNLMHHPTPLALRVSISKLKKKTGLDIKSIRGLGYTLDED